jgi:xanthine dehydrogenase accessory factor
MTEKNDNHSLVSPFILIKGAGEMASAIAWRLYQANMRHICMLDLEKALAVRRQVSFCTVFEDTETSVEGVPAISVKDGDGIDAAWNKSKIAVTLTTDWDLIEDHRPDVVIDAILAKRNTGTALADAPLVIALGPGFEAGADCHLLIETNRGHNLGRIIENGAATPNTGIPGAISGHTAQRVLRAPAAGTFKTDRVIGDLVKAGDVVGQVEGNPLVAEIDGILRGLIKPGTVIPRGLKIGDIDPRGDAQYCDTISDKARAIGGSVLEAIMRQYNKAA